MITSRDKEKSLQVLEKDLDAVFSDFIRMRDSVDGKVNCFVCGKSVPWKKSENGHFIPRAKMPTRYHEKNCHAVCTDCNRYDPMHDFKYNIRMIMVYGAEVSASLKRLSQSLAKFMRSDLIELIDKYKLKVAELRRTKHL